MTKYITRNEAYEMLQEATLLNWKTAISFYIEYKDIINWTLGELYITDGWIEETALPYDVSYFDYYRMVIAGEIVHKETRIWD